MSDTFKAPDMLEDADRLGARRATEAEAEEFITKHSNWMLRENRLVDCKLEKNKGRKCWETECYNGEKLAVYCANGRCEERRFIPCP